MDKFTKTTEMDISAMEDVEEVHKKSSIGSIIAIILCLFFAVIIWLYAMEINSTEQTREYNDVSVELIGNDGYDVRGSLSIDVVLVGTNKNLVDIKKDDIRVVLDFSKINNFNYGKEHEYSVDIYLPDEYSSSVFGKQATIKLTINEK
jgi:YbbR domain-containing protein